MLSIRRNLLRGSTPLIVSLLVAACSVAPPPAVPHPSGGSASSSPPAGLAPSSVPQFVVFGFDDNGISGAPGSGTTGGVRWVRELFDGKRNPPGRGNALTHDGEPARFSLYLATRYIAEPDTDRPEHMKAELHAVAAAGHEIGMHTHTHSHGEKFSSAEWAAEIATCKDWLTKPFVESELAQPSTGLGLDPAGILGFRAPFLEYGPPLFPAVRGAGLSYDCSVEEGFEERFSGTDLVWPYRIASGYGERSSAAAGEAELWELPVYAVIVPPDEACERYGVEPGLRARLHAVRDYLRPEDGKITGFDWNLWVDFGMTAKEFVATLEYTLDQRLAGNRAPLLFGTHSDIYSEQYETLPTSTAEERRRALAEVLGYVLARPEARVVSARQLLDWLRSPAPL
jgi:peptidoglycan/xylan/chitin deacetylase (PgdA/CDA1 family)